MLRMQKWQEEDGGVKQSLRGGIPSTPRQATRQQAASPASPGRKNPRAGREKRRASAGFTRIPGAASNRKKYRSPATLSFRVQGQEQILCAGELASCPSWARAWWQQGRGRGMFWGLRAVLPTVRPGSAALEGRYLSCSMRGGPWSKGAFISPGARWLLLSCTRASVRVWAVNPAVEVGAGGRGSGA